MNDCLGEMARDKAQSNAVMLLNSNVIHLVHLLSYLFQLETKSLFMGIMTSAPFINGFQIIASLNICL